MAAVRCLYRVPVPALLAPVPSDIAQGFDVAANLARSVYGGAPRSSFYVPALFPPARAMARSLIFNTRLYQVGDFAILIRSGFSKEQAIVAQFLTSGGGFVGAYSAAWVQQARCRYPGVDSRGAKLRARPGAVRRVQRRGGRRGGRCGGRRACADGRVPSPATNGLTRTFLRACCAPPAQCSVFRRRNVWHVFVEQGIALDPPVYRRRVYLYRPREPDPGEQLLPFLFVLAVLCPVSGLGL